MLDTLTAVVAAPPPPPPTPPTPPPSPVGARSLDELILRLTELRAWAGGPSYADIARIVGGRRSRTDRTVPGKVTIYDCFRPGRRRVDIELLVDIVHALGAGPSADEWRQAHRAILHGDAAARLVRVHDHLPPASEPFVGRADELRLLGTSRERVSVIVGMPGVGKTELALHAAHAAAAAEYDATHHVDLRGYTPEHRPADPAAVLETLLRQLHVPPSVIHGAGVAGRRSLLAEVADRVRLLLVLDNARDAEQVVPLLPGGRTRVLVTSRRALTIPGAQRLSLAPLSAAHALELLRRASGIDLPADTSTRRLVDLCGRLPLHLRMVAAHLADTPAWSMHDQVQRLESAPAGRAARTALDTSYACLPAAAQQLLRRLALHPGHDVGAEAAAVLTDVSREEAARLLDLLVSEHLVEDDDGMYRLNDVVRAYAVARGLEEDPLSGQLASLQRLVRHYQRETPRVVRRTRLDHAVVRDMGDVEAHSLA